MAIRDRMIELRSDEEASSSQKDTGSTEDNGSRNNLIFVPSLSVQNFELERINHEYVLVSSFANLVRLKIILFVYDLLRLTFLEEMHNILKMIPFGAIRILSIFLPNESPVMPPRKPRLDLTPTNEHDRKQEPKIRFILQRHLHL